MSKIRNQAKKRVAAMHNICVIASCNVLADQFVYPFQIQSALLMHKH